MVGSVQLRLCVLLDQQPTRAWEGFADELGADGGAAPRVVLRRSSRSLSRLADILHESGRSKARRKGNVDENLLDAPRCCGGEPAAESPKPSGVKPMLLECEETALGVCRHQCCKLHKYMPPLLTMYSAPPLASRSVSASRLPTIRQGLREMRVSRCAVLYV